MRDNILEPPGKDRHQQPCDAGRLKREPVVGADIDNHDDHDNHIRTAAPTTSNGASDSEAIEIDGKDYVQPLHCVRGDSTVKPQARTLQCVRDDSAVKSQARIQGVLSLRNHSTVKFRAPRARGRSAEKSRASSTCNRVQLGERRGPDHNHSSPMADSYISFGSPIRNQPTRAASVSINSMRVDREQGLRSMGCVYMSVMMTLDTSLARVSFASSF